MKKFTTPEIEVRELFASDSVMADIDIIASANAQNDDKYNYIDADVDNAVSYSMWKGYNN